MLLLTIISDGFVNDVRKYLTNAVESDTDGIKQVRLDTNMPEGRIVCLEIRLFDDVHLVVLNLC
jgi:hypothetical protein